MDFSYASLIVTYNRKDKLVKALNSLFSQTQKPTRIIIIDNCSTDGTEDLLKKKGFLKSNIVDYNKMSKNYGGSGGFYYGVKRAIAFDDVEYLSFSDDDAYFEPKFFEKIAESQKKHPKCKAFCGTVKYANGQIQFDHRRKIINPKWIKEQEFCLSDYNQNFFVDTFSFVGSVVSMDILSEIGLPHKDYFIYYDDTEYSLRIRNKTKVINVSNAKVTHDITIRNKRKGNLISWKNYYELRNSILMKKEHSNWQFLWLYFYYRQIRLYCFILMTKEFKGERRRALTVYTHGFRDGMKGITGKIEPFTPNNF
ncbi:glycosyltransferase [Limosilactobacillus vaginalis]|uniref:glycosyltransferase n=1 Tax=Limosilactobacillus vaginalis TaxID=1633 RepID=UPI003F20C111